MRPTDYKHIVAWGRYSGIPSSMIRKRQKQAYDDNALIDAMFKKDGVDWFVFEELQGPARELVQTALDNLK